MKSKLNNLDKYLNELSSVTPNTNKKFENLYKVIVRELVYENLNDILSRFQQDIHRWHMERERKAFDLKNLLLKLKNNL